MSIEGLSSTVNPLRADLLPEALAYAGRGWSIIPVIGKRPAGLWRPFQEAPADETTLRQMFAKSRVTGLAVVTGKVSGGLAIRDFDRADSYIAWASANHDDAARLPTVKTARGFHVYGLLDQEAFETFPDGELRADCKHYVLLPPSLHPDGVTYVWVIALPAPGQPLPLLPLSLAQGQPTTQAPPANPANPLHVLHARPGDIQAAIASTLPDGQGQRNRRLFDLARQLKGLMPDAGPDELRAIVRQWHERALPAIRTKGFSESWTDFAIAWERVKRPAGQSFRTAAAAVENHLPAVANTYDGNLQRLVGLCWHLQQQWQGRPFPLSCRKAAEFLDGISHVHAWRLLKTLQYDGLLKLITRGTKRSGKANEWHFRRKKTDEDETEKPHKTRAKRRIETCLNFG